MILKIITKTMLKLALVKQLDTTTTAGLITD